MRFEWLYTRGHIVSQKACDRVTPPSLVDRGGVLLTLANSLHGIDWSVLFQMADSMDVLEDPLGGRPWSKKRPLEEDDGGPPLKQTKVVQDFLDTLPNTSNRWYYWTAPSVFVAPVEYRRPAEKDEKKFMDDHKLWRPQLSQWLKESHQHLKQHMTDTQRCVLYDWSTNDYERIMAAYTRDEPVAQWHSLFFGPQSLAMHLPRDAVLFEGHDTYRPVETGTVIRRKRPTSTSWLFRSALGFTGIHNEESNGVVYAYRFPDSSVRAINLQMDYVGPWKEAEVVLQPGIQIQIDEILFHQQFRFNQRDVHIVFATVTTPSL